MMTPSVPRWGRQASAVQPRQPAFWLFCGLLAVGGLLFVDDLFELLDQADHGATTENAAGHALGAELF